MGTIKVIKKGQAPVGEPTESKPGKYESKQAARDMVSTVSDWVREIQKKKKSESELSVERLFGGLAQTSDA